MSNQVTSKMPFIKSSGQQVSILWTLVTYSYTFTGLLAIFNKRVKQQKSQGTLAQRRY